LATVEIRTNYYQQFDCDFGSEVPTEGFGGWRQALLPLDLEHTALVSMHAWNCGSRERYPGWHRCAEWIPRAAGVLGEVFPPLLAAVRRSPMRLMHVVNPGTYYRQYRGYRETLALAGPEPTAETVLTHTELDVLRHFRDDNVLVGAHNQADVTRGFAELDFAPEARPMGNEPIAETSHQLLALCRAHDIGHLIYTGFCIDGCLLMSPGGMLDMTRLGIICSAVRQATTAIENRETARLESNKEAALWRVALLFGFVYDADDLLASLAPMPGDPA
jgi:hypothetical protein